MSSTASTSASLPPLRELREYLARFIARCRAASWLGALFHARVVEDIAADLARQHRALSATAYTAEQADLEAARLLDEAARDGFSQADLPAVERAVRLIRRSAAHDRRLCDQLA